MPQPNLPVFKGVAVRLLYSLVFPCLLLSIGCSGKDPNLPELVPVTGVVTLDEMPLKGAVVTFIPTGSTLGAGCMALTGTDGRYELATHHQGTGAPVGDYRVVISKLVNPDGTDFVTTPDMDPMSSAHKELLPAKYSDTELTELKATVPAGGGTIDFPLKSKP